MPDKQEVNVPDIKPQTFPLKIHDAKGAGIKGSFKISVDGSQEETRDTDDSGNVMVGKPKKEIKITIL